MYNTRMVVNIKNKQSNLDLYNDLKTGISEIKRCFTNYNSFQI